MKATSGNLRVDQEYELVGVHYGMSACENCGHPLTNIAEVKGSDDGRHYFIGLDCASTLTGIKADSMAQAKKLMARMAKHRKEVSKGYYGYVKVVGEWARFYKNDTVPANRWVFQSKFANYQDLIEAGSQARAKWNEDPIKVEQVSSFE